MLILGGGFGGIYTYRELLKLSRNLDITIVNRSDNFLFTPLLPEVITGELRQEDVEEPITTIIGRHPGRLVVGEVRSVDLDKQLVETTAGMLSYDYLVLALGSQTNFYGTPGADHNCLVLKNVDDVERICDRLRHQPNEQLQATNIAIVGAGPTGIELAVKLRELSRSLGQKCPIYLIEKDDWILPSLNSNLRTKALKIIAGQEITLLTQRSIARVSAGQIHFAHGETLEAASIIWTAGVTPQVPGFTTTIMAAVGGRLMVDEYLRIIDQPRVFALGDIAACRGSREKTLPPLAQVAVKQSRSLARNIARSIKEQPLEAFHYQPIGMFIPLGRFKGIGTVMGFNISGRTAWLGWKLLNVYRFPSPAKRLKIAVQWLKGAAYAHKGVS